MERARESGKPDPLIKDDYTRNIVESLDFDNSLFANMRPGCGMDFNPTEAWAYTIGALIQPKSSEDGAAKYMSWKNIRYLPECRSIKNGTKKPFPRSRR